MEKRLSWKWIAAGFAIFAVSRLFVIFGYERYWTDVALYHEAAFYGVEGGYRAYRDFWFPYPPMSLPLIYAPMLAATEISAYRRVFQWEMFLFDFGTVLYLVLFLRERVAASSKSLFGAVAIYAGFGMLVGHLIYDRLDIVIAFVFMASLYHFTSSKRPRLGKGIAYTFALSGALMKLLPLLWAPIFVIVEFFRISNVAQALVPHSPRGDGGSSLSAGEGLAGRWGGERGRIGETVTGRDGDGEGKGECSILNNQCSIFNGDGGGILSKGGFARALVPLVAVFAFFVVAIFAYDATTRNPKSGKGLLAIMGEHGDRGIQMESNWAMPMMCVNLARKLSEKPIFFHLETVYGAQHFKKTELSSTYVTAAKYAGFALLGLMYAAIIAMAFFRSDFRAGLTSPEWILSAMLGALLFVIATQRVLSPQYLIWVMPGLVAAVFARVRVSIPRLALFFAIFALTYLEFDIGYELLTRMDSLFVAILILRNLLLVAAGLMVLCDVFMIKKNFDSCNPHRI